MSLFLSRIVNIAGAMFSSKDIDLDRCIKKKKNRESETYTRTGLWNRREIHECYNMNVILK